MTFREWVQTSSGLWWWRASGPDGLSCALGIDDRNTEARRTVTVVPAGAPLLGRVTPIDNCRAYARLFGVRRTSHELLTSLRTLDLPDDYAGRLADELDELHRILTWLAMARLASTSMVVLVEPMTGASQSQRSHLRQVLQEALAFHNHIFVAAHHQESAVSLGAQRFPACVVAEP